MSAMPSSTSARTVAGLAGAWHHARRLGGISAVLAAYLSLVGIVPVFNARPLIDGVVSLGQAFLIGTGLVVGYLAAQR